jgi:hypothetical protein
MRDSAQIADVRVPNQALPQKSDATGTSVGEHAERWWLAWEWDTKQEYHTHTWCEDHWIVWAAPFTP